MAGAGTVAVKRGKRKERRGTEQGGAAVDPLTREGNPPSTAKNAESAKRTTDEVKSRAECPKPRA